MIPVNLFSHVSMLQEQEINCRVHFTIDSNSNEINYSRGNGILNSVAAQLVYWLLYIS